MATLYYMALPGVGDWSSAMREVGAQLSPYARYLKTAKRAADARALSLAWRLSNTEELKELNRRLSERIARANRKAADADRRRDRHAQQSVPRGIWISLESRPGRGEEPETTFDAFFQANDVWDQPPEFGRRWSDAAKIEVQAVDREARALLLQRLPSEVKSEQKSSGNGDGNEELRAPLLFLRPNTWPLECHERALRALENRPLPRLAPLLRLATTRPVWGGVAPAEIREEAWTFLRQSKDGSLRDGALEQREFVRKALATPDFALLEGPPGSGKTTAICELITQAVRSGKRVLLVASTHVAVDNVLERLIDWQDSGNEKSVLPVRIGDDGSVTSEKVIAWTLRNLQRTWPGEILDYLDRPAEGSPAGAEARAILRNSINQDGADAPIVRLILESSNLVCGTTIGILQHPAIKAAQRERRNNNDVEPFDFLILDEASKTTLTEFLVPAVLARRWIVVGDRRQLSPYVEEQDLSENIAGLLPPSVSSAAMHAYAATSRNKRRSLVAVQTSAEAVMLEAEAKARGVHAVNLDLAVAKSVFGVDGALTELLYADIFCGAPETLSRFEHRLPGDLDVVSGPIPALLDWNAHRSALDAVGDEEPLSWSSEVAWRQIRAYELRFNTVERARLLKEIQELRPKAVDQWSHLVTDKGRPNGAPARDIAADLDRDLDTIRRVAMPSILEILQDGAGSMGWSQKTTLTDGLPKDVLRARLTSLSFQHRMHPEISGFPREQFYQHDGLLKDAGGMLEARDWAYSRYAGRAVWLDIPPSPHRGGSRVGNTNTAEADAVIAELREFAQWASRATRPGPDPTAPWEVAVLTFYRGQEGELRHRLQRESGQRGNTRNFTLPNGSGRVHVTLCTVDSFQGHEADVVFLSFVKTRSVGFLNSPNRLNVALTRARYQVVLVGHQSWMASERCSSPLLRSLGTSSHYKRDIGWENP